MKIIMATFFRIFPLQDWYRADGQRLRGDQHAHHDACGHRGDAAAGARGALREVHAQRWSPPGRGGEEHGMALQPGQRHDCPQAGHHGDHQV